MYQYTIITVSLNTKKKFLKTINSIKKQTFKNYEVIIVDGNSEDGTVKEIKKIKSKNIKYIIEKDKGIYDGMNKGIINSKGKWIIFLNSGDTFFSKNTLKYIDKKKINDQDILFGDTFIKNKYFRYRSFAKQFDKETILMPFCHQSVLVKRSYLLRNKFSPKYKIASDFDFFLKSFLRNKSFYNLNMIVSQIESGGISDKKRNKVFDENIEIVKKYKLNFLIILNLYIYKFLDFIKVFLKIILPEKINHIILRVKYNK